MAIRVHKGIDDVHDDEQSELDPEPQEVTDYIRDRHHQAGEIHLAEDAGVFHERVGCLGDTVGEILPQAGTGQIEERSRYAVGRDAGDAAEHDHVHDDRESRLDDEPERAQDGLLVLGDDISFDKQGAQVPVLPQFLEIHREETVLRFDDKIPLFFCHICQCDRLCLNRMLPTVPQKYRQSVAKGCLW